MLRNIETPGSSSSRDEENNDHDDDTEFRDIHALTPTAPAALSRRSSNMSVASDLTISSSENFTTMSREFNALVLAGSTIVDHANNSNLERIGEDEEENNPLAIVPDNSNPLPDDHISHVPISFTRSSTAVTTTTGSDAGDIGVHRVKKDEVDAKIAAWETAKIAKINNRFKREDAIITGWENEQVHKASTRMKIVERKLEEKRAKAMEKMQNEIAKAHRKAEERRASAEGKRGIKVAKVLQVSNLMRAVGRPPAKRSFF